MNSRLRTSRPEGPITAAPRRQARRDRRQRRPDAHPPACRREPRRRRRRRRPARTTDQRGVARPQNGKCDIGAVGVRGRGPARRRRRPGDVYFDAGPIQDTSRRWPSASTAATTDGGGGAAVRVPDPRDRADRGARDRSPPGTRSRRSCSGGVQQPVVQVPLVEEGLFTFEVRAIDRAGNVDRTSRVTSSAGPTGSRPTPASWSTRRRARRPGRDLHLHRAGQPDPAAVHGVRVPSRHPRPGPVAGVLQPGDLLQPDDRHAHASRCGRPTATTTSTPVRRASPGRWAPPPGRRRGRLRRRQHQPDCCRRRLGRRGERERELPLRDRPHGALGRRRRATARAERPVDVPLRPACRLVAAATSSRPRSSCTPDRPPPAGRSRPCRSRARSRRAPSPGATSPP